MHTRTLGKTDLKLSEVSLGTWGLADESYGPVTEATFEQTIRAALDSGVTTIDMSPLWGFGRGEEIVARVTKEQRDDLVYVTRGGATWIDEMVHHRFEPEALVADCEASLERLGTDRIDLWLLHNPPASLFHQDEWKETVEKLLTDGKIRAWGVSIANTRDGESAIEAGAQAISVPYNLVQSDVLHDLSGSVTTAGCGVLASSPLCYGLLAGRWNKRRAFAESDHRGGRWTTDVLQERIRTVNSLRFLCHGPVQTMFAASLRYVMANAFVTTALVGARTPSQIHEACKCIGEPPYLPSDDLARVPQVLTAR